MSTKSLCKQENECSSYCWRLVDLSFFLQIFRCFFSFVHSAQAIRERARVHSLVRAQHRCVHCSIRSSRDLVIFSVLAVDRLFDREFFTVCLAILRLPISVHRFVRATFTWLFTAHRLYIGPSTMAIARSHFILIAGRRASISHVAGGVCNVHSSPLRSLYEIGEQPKSSHMPNDGPYNYVCVSESDVCVGIVFAGLRAHDLASNNNNNNNACLFCTDRFILLYFSATLLLWQRLP